MLESMQNQNQNVNMQRVKVYRLNRDGLWDDKGTGHVSMEYMEQSDSVGLVVISEEDTRTLLIHRISREDIYQRQGDDTIITWTDPEVGTDIALSFQEAQGCNYVWGQILEVQGHFNSRAEGGTRRRGAVDEFENLSSQLESEPFQDAAGNAADLPAPELGNLAEICKVLTECSPFQREKVAQQMLRPAYIRKLLELFRTCEDLEDKESLALIYKTVKGAIMLNDTSLFEVLLKEENVMDVVGALEYDPDLSEQQKYREFLRDSVVFKEVVPIKDKEVLGKIHQTYRIGYIKDVILPRVLDDATFATLASLMLFNNVEVLMALQSDAEFMQELFNRLRGAMPHGSDWTDLVAFLQELCSLAKHLQATHRMQLFTKLLDLGMLDVLTEVMRSGNAELRLRGSDVLLSTLQHDPSPLRTFLLKQPDHTLFTLLVGSLVDDCSAASAPGSHAGTRGGLQEQVLEMLRLLLDPETMEQAVEKNEFLELFYDRYVDKLVQTLTSSVPGASAASAAAAAAAAAEKQKRASGGAAPGASVAAVVPTGPASPATLGIIVELLCFCVQHHSYRIKYYILRNNVVEKVLRLLKCRQRWLVVAAVRFLRTCIGLKDDFYNRYLVRNNLLEPVVKAFVDNGRRYNLLNSSILELVEFVRRENIKGLISHLVEEFHEHTFEGIDYVDTFKQLKLKYDQQQERATGGGADPGVVGAASASAAASARELLMANRRRRDNDRGLDRDEEDYFNEDDEDEDVQHNAPSTGPKMIGPLPAAAAAAAAAAAPAGTAASGEATATDAAAAGGDGGGGGAVASKGGGGAAAGQGGVGGGASSSDASAALDNGVSANPLFPLVDYDDDDDEEDDGQQQGGSGAAPQQEGGEGAAPEEQQQQQEQSQGAAAEPDAAGGAKRHPGAEAGAADGTESPLKRQRSGGAPEDGTLIPATSTMPPVAAGAGPSGVIWQHTS